MKDEISMPMDYEKLIVRNSPDVKVRIQCMGTSWLDPAKVCPAQPEECSFNSDTGASAGRAAAGTRCASV